MAASWFPGGIYDTKYLAGRLPDLFADTGLGALHDGLLLRRPPQVDSPAAAAAAEALAALVPAASYPAVRHAPGFERYEVRAEGALLPPCPLHHPHAIWAAQRRTPLPSAALRTSFSHKKLYRLTNRTASQTVPPICQTCTAAGRRHGAVRARGRVRRLHDRRRLCRTSARLRRRRPGRHRRRGGGCRRCSCCVGAVVPGPRLRRRPRPGGHGAAGGGGAVCRPAQRLAQRPAVCEPAGRGAAAGPLPRLPRQRLGGGGAPARRRPRQEAVRVGAGAGAGEPGGGRPGGAAGAGGPGGGAGEWPPLLLGVLLCCWWGCSAAGGVGSGLCSPVLVF